MNRQTTVTTWIRLVIASVLAVTVGTALTGATPAQATTPGAFVPQTSFAIDANPTAPDDFDDGYGFGVTPGGYPTTGVYHRQVSVDGAGRTPVVPACGSSQDDVGAPGVSADDGPTWLVQDGAVSPKFYDVQEVAFAAERVDVDGDANDILYMGYRLCQEPNGAFNIVISLLGPDGVSPSTDDRIIIFNFTPNDSTATVYRWDGASNWIVDGSYPESGPEVESAISVDQTFGEIALNLTAMGLFDSVGEPPVLECKTLQVGGQAASLAGNSPTSDMKDVLLVDPFPITNCGGLDVEKRSDPLGIATGPIFDYLVEQADDAEVHDATLSSNPGGLGEPDGDVTEIDAAIGAGDQHGGRTSSPRATTRSPRPRRRAAGRSNRSSARTTTSSRSSRAGWSSKARASGP